MDKKFPVYKGLNLAQINKEVLASWEQEGTFEQSLKNREDAPSFIFFEGPPSANGMPGNGKLTVTGSTSTEAKEDIKNTYNYIRANERTILSQQHSLMRLDVTVQITTLLGVSVHKGIGGAVFAGIVSSIFGRNLKSALGVIGNISIISMREKGKWDECSIRSFILSYKSIH